MNFNQKAFEKLYNEHTYTCDICHYIILPMIRIAPSGKDIEITSESQSIKGGKGNKALYKKVCPICAEKIRKRR